jgi:hypothetical protein
MLIVCYKFSDPKLWSFVPIIIWRSLTDTPLKTKIRMFEVSLFNDSMFYIKMQKYICDL